MISLKSFNNIAVIISCLILGSCGWVNNFASDWGMDEKKYAGIEVEGWNRAPSPNDDVGNQVLVSNLPVPEGLDIPSNIRKSYKNDRPLLGFKSSPRGINGDFELAAVEKVNGRIGKLEKIVMSIRDDMNKIAPVLARLSKSESELVSVIEYIKKHSSGNGSLINASIDTNSDVIVDRNYSKKEYVAISEEDASVEMAYLMAGIEPAVGNNIAAKSKRVFAEKIRFGIHPNKTRIVIDVSDKVNFEVDLDNSEKFLVVDIDGVSWNDVQQRMIGSSDLLSFYDVQPLTDTNGVRIFIGLEKIVNLKMSKLFEPLPDAGKSYRIVLDISEI